MNALDTMTHIFAEQDGEALGNLAYHEDVETPIFCGNEGGGWNSQGKM